MLFLSYKEVDYDFIYKNTLKNIFFKQNLQLKHLTHLKLPEVNLFFDYRRIVELNLLKVFYNIMLLWLFTGQLANFSDLKTKFERGVRYHSFICYTIINNGDLFLNFIDIIVNSFFIIRDNQKKLLNKNDFLFIQLQNLEIFSNVRLSNYYTPRVLNFLNLLFRFKDKGNNYNLSNINYFLKNFKLY
jgi:hypothetical protein